MTAVYVDTSAFLAVLDADDANHARARQVWVQLLTSQTDLVCTSYVLVETHALLQRRLGLDAVRVFHRDILPLLHVEWVDESLHQYAGQAVLTAGHRDLSLVDCAGFALMRLRGVTDAFAFDKHFAAQGFRLR